MSSTGQQQHTDTGVHLQKYHMKTSEYLWIGYGDFTKTKVYPECANYTCVCGWNKELRQQRKMKLSPGKYMYVHLALVFQGQWTISGHHPYVNDTTGISDISTNCVQQYDASFADTVFWKSHSQKRFVSINECQTAMCDMILLQNIAIHMYINTYNLKYMIFFTYL